MHIGMCLTMTSEETKSDVSDQGFTDVPPIGRPEVSRFQYHAFA